MPEMVNAYLSYDLNGPPQEEEAEVPKLSPVEVITLNSKSRFLQMPFKNKWY